MQMLIGIMIRKNTDEKYKVNIKTKFKRNISSYLGMDDPLDYI